MTKIVFYIDGENQDQSITNVNYRALEIDGHTKKEVCNAISVLGWTLAGTLKNICEIDFIEKDGYMFIATKEITPQTNTAFETILVGMQQIEKTHKKHVNPIDFKVKNAQPE